MKQKTLTLKQLYKVGTVKLAEEGIEEFSLDAWYLLEYVTGVSKAKERPIKRLFWVKSVLAFSNLSS